MDAYNNYNKYRDLFIGVDNPVQLANGSMDIPIEFDNGQLHHHLNHLIGNYVED